MIGERHAKETESMSKRNERERKNEVVNQVNDQLYNLKGRGGGIIFFLIYNMDINELKSE